MSSQDDYKKWFESIYGNIINIKKLDKKADNNKNKWLKLAVQNFVYKYSSIWRFENLSEIKHYLYPKKTEYICTSFKIFRKSSTSIIQNKNNDEYINTIYAMMYSSYDEKTNEINCEFISASPTFRSSDGEYRHRFISVNQFINIYETNIKLTDMVEQHLIQQLDSGDIWFDINHIIPNNSKETAIKLNKIIDTKRFAILFYVSSWFVDFIRYHNKVIENHINEGFVNAMFSKDDVDLYKLINENNTLFNIGNIQIKFTKHRRDENHSTMSLELGQKFIPVSIYDVESVNDLTLSPWREIYIAKLVSNLIINGISPNYPLYNDWFFIQGNTNNFWSNKISHIKIQHSEITKKIVKSIEAARRGAFIINPIDKKELYLSYNMEGLSQAIEIPMDYAEQEIILADYILCSLTEHLGRTLADVPALMMYDEYNTMIAGPMFKNFSLFSKMIFEYCYGLYCLNDKYGIVHGDIHLNNVTIFNKRHIVKTVYDQVDRNKMPDVYPLVINPHVIYNIVTNDKELYYIFPSSGCNAGIIDFSRAFIYNDIIKKEFGDKYDIILNDQKRRLMKTLEKEIPDFYNSNKDNLELTLINNFNETYKIFMGVDMFKLSRGILSMVHNVMNNKIYVEKYVNKSCIIEKVIPLLEKINDISYKYITNNFMRLFKLLPKQTFHVENINLTLIKECFEQFNLDKYTPPLHNGDYHISIIDFFSTGNELKYDIRNYGTIPEISKLDYIIKNNIDVDKLGIDNFYKILDYINNETIESKIDKIQNLVINSKKIRRGYFDNLDIEDDNNINDNDNIVNNVNNKPELTKEFQDLSSNIESYYFDT